MANNLHAYKESFLISDCVVNMWVAVGSMTVTLVCSPNSPLAPCTAYCMGGSTHPSICGVMVSEQWKINLFSSLIPPFLSF